MANNEYIKKNLQCKLPQCLAEKKKKKAMFSYNIKGFVCRHV